MKVRNCGEEQSRESCFILYDYQLETSSLCTCESALCTGIGPKELFTAK